MTQQQIIDIEKQIKEAEEKQEARGWELVEVFKSQWREYLESIKPKGMSSIQWAFNRFANESPKSKRQDQKRASEMMDRLLWNDPEFQRLDKQRQELRKQLANAKAQHKQDGKKQPSVSAYIEARRMTDKIPPEMRGMHQAGSLGCPHCGMSQQQCKH